MGRLTTLQGMEKLEIAVSDHYPPNSRPSHTNTPVNGQQPAEGIMRGLRASVTRTTVVSLIAECAEANGTATAIRDANGDVCYRELLNRFVALAGKLREAGIRPGDPVAVSTSRSADAIVAMLAVWRAGATYVPLDLGLPIARREFMVQDSECRLLLTDDDPATRLGDLPALSMPRDWTGRFEHAPDLSDPAETAYIIYTSGSTGQPKGVPISHAALTNFTAALSPILALDAFQTVAAVASVAFDISLLDFVVPLCSAATVAILERRTATDGSALAAALSAHGATVLQATPSTWQLLRQAGWHPRGPFTALSAGEPLPRDLADWLVDRCTRVINGYGPTEGTIYVTCQEIGGAELDACDPAPLGQPLANVDLYLLDEHGRPVPGGSTGEIYVSGAALASGYLNREEETARAFVPDLIRGTGVMYRTGDLARVLPGGALQYLGRRDHQVKVRGYRVEIGEVEAAVGSHPDVAQVAVLTDHDASGSLRLVAYLRAASRDADLTLLVGGVREFVGSRLPGYMVPSAFVVVDSFPLTANGKVDRVALAAQGGRQESGRAFVAPRGAVESLVAAVFGEVLEVEGVGASDDFFELGGHSLLATQVVARLHAALGVTVGVRLVFECPTVSALAAAVAEIGEQDDRGREDPILARQTAGPVALSFAQQRLWFLQQLDPEGAQYNLWSVLRLQGPLDVSALSAAFSAVLERHEVLRTRVEVHDGIPMQVIDPPTPMYLRPEPVPGPRDWSHAEALARAEVARPFDLTASAPLRVRLWQLGEQEHLLVIVVHHIASDDWSHNIFVRDLTEAYAVAHDGQPARLPAPTVHYADVAEWQHQRDLTPSLHYWRERLAGLSGAELLVDLPRPAVRSGRGATVRFELPEELRAGLLDLGRGSGASLFMTLLAAFQLLLSRYSGRRDVAVGTPIANRERAEVADVVGLFVNTVVLRADLAADPTFVELLEAVRDSALDAYEHQNLPFDRLVEELHPDRELGRTPLFQVMFAADQLPSSEWTLPGLDVQEVEIASTTAKVDVSLHLTDEDGVLSGRVEFACDVLSAGFVDGLIEHYRQVLASVVADPSLRVSEVPVLTAAERELVLHGWNDTTVEYPQRCLHEWVSRQARRSPDAPAAVQADRSLSYGELEARANALAWLLLDLGVHVEDRVAVLLPRGVDALVAALAVMKAGAAYTPLDPELPAERLKFIIDDAGVQVVLTDSTLAATLSGSPARLVHLDRDPPADLPIDAPPVAVGPDNLAYLIYTSGSSGQPKGTLIEHRAIANNLLWMQRNWPLHPTDRLLAKTSCGFDVSVKELFWPAMAGAAVVFADSGGHRDPAYLRSLIIEQHVTVAHFVPSMLRLFLDLDLDDCRSLRLVMCGAETLAPDLLQRFHDRLSAQLLHMYGPTETTIAITGWLADTDNPANAHTVPLGRAMDNVALYVLDNDDNPVPIGVAGELCVAGTALARGYLNRPQETAQAFVDNPFTPGQRMYRTGDLVRYRPDGILEFLGRHDQQVKVRGYRIELGEIEATLNSHPQITQAVVTADTTDPTNTTLTAYLTTNTTTTLTPRQLRDHVALRLPLYMVPSAFVVTAALPLTANGKIDLGALPAPSAADLVRAEYEAPNTPAQQILAAMWSELLDVAQIGLNDNFFDLGGHSLLATRLAHRVAERFGIKPPLRLIFAAPTLGEFCVAVGAAAAAALRATFGSDAERTPAAPIAPNHTEETPPSRPSATVTPPPSSAEHGVSLVRRIDRDIPLPLSFAQRRLWFLDQAELSRQEYNIAFGLRLVGPLDQTALLAALSDLANRHEVLRTTFTVQDGAPMQVIGPRSRPPIDFCDQSHLPPERARRISDDQAAANAARTFDLTVERPMHAWLTRIADQEHDLLLVVHHIAADGWSRDLLVRDLKELYSSHLQQRPVAVDSDRLDYADFACWEREWLTDERLSEQMEYWRERLAGLSGAELLVDLPRPAVRSGRGATVRFELPEELRAGLLDLGRGSGASLFMTLLAAFQLLLSRYSGRRDVAVGTPIANRERAEVADVVGFFVNTVVLRADLAADPTFVELLEAVRDSALDAYEHQNLPFDRLVEELHPDRELGRTPLFQVMFQMRRPGPPWALEGLVVTERTPTWETAMYDLTLDVGDEDGVLSGRVEFACDVLSAGFVDGLIEHYRQVLASVVADPSLRVSEVPVLTAAERELVLHGWNDTTVEYPQRCLHEWVSRQARRSPDAPAAVQADRSLSYGELEARANALAWLLLDLGVHVEDRVAVLLPRGVDALVAALAVMKAGAAYTPLDPELPAERLKFIIDDAGVQVVLTDSTLAATLSGSPARLVHLDRDPPADLPIDAPPVAVGPDNLAYLIYTSGSSGQPKGTLIEHRAIANNLLWMQRNWPLHPTDRLLAKTSCGFDVSVKELFWPAMAGAAVVFADSGGHRDPAYLRSLIIEQHVTVAHFVPSMLRLFLDLDLDDCRSLRLVMCGAETLAPDLLQRFHDRLSAQLLHMYGPTETTIAITGWLADTDNPANAHTVPLGRAMDNVALYVLDNDDNPVPIGVAGELCVAGTALARGYLNRPQETAQAFVDNPFTPGQRMYRTGDLVRYRPDGILEFLGRHDQQVKVRGYRIELGEIEATLNSHPQITQAVVTADTTDPTNTTLTAYLTTNTTDGDGSDASAEHLQQWHGVFADTDAHAASADLSFDITGWNSSYDAEPIPAEQMAEWVDTTVARILAGHPRRVLEIGCGSGLLTWRVAPHCERYVATDFSAQTVAQLSGALGGSGLDHVTVLCAEATDLSHLEPVFDTIVINSVVQYFPDADYLQRVLLGAAGLLDGEGRIFVGDVRHLGLLETFHASVELARIPANATAGSVRERVRRRGAREEELVIGPDFFRSLATHIPGCWDVQITPRLGRHWNEMTAFRYDVTFHVGTPVPALAVSEWRDWASDVVTEEALEQQLSRSRPATLGLHGCPNRRLVAVNDATLRLAGTPDEDTVDPLEIGTSGAANVTDPQSLADLADRLGYQVETSWAATRPDGAFDAVFFQSGTNGTEPVVTVPRPDFALPVPREGSERTINDPARTQADVRRRALLVGGVREFVGSRLPGYMVPSAFVVVDSFPLTANGKVDRVALAAQGGRQESGRAFVAPRGAVESLVAAVFGEVLEVEGVGASDDFFELGGHSLLATQVVARLHAALGVTVGVRLVFECPTVSALAAAVAEIGEQDDRGREDPILARQTAGPVALSFAQQRLWFLQQLDPEGAQYNLWSVLRLQGPLDVSALSAAFSAVLERHEVLRTRVEVHDGIPMQVIDPPTPMYLRPEPVPGPRDWSHAEALARAEVARPFDLTASAPLRVRLWQLGEQEHLLVIVVHHIASDGWSHDLFVRDLGRAWETGTLPAATGISYAHYARRQREALTADGFARELAYWTRRLETLEPGEVAADLRRVDAPSGPAAVASARVPAPLAANLAQRAAAAGASRFMLLLAAYQLVLSRWTATPEVTVGSPVAGRDPDTQELFGLLVNTLVFAARVDEERSFGELLAATRADALDAYDHAELPFELLVDAINPVRALGRTPLFQSLFSFTPAAQRDWHLPGLAVAEQRIETPKTKFDLTLGVSEDADGLSVQLVYRADLFTPATAQSIVEAFVAALVWADADWDAPLRSMPLRADRTTGVLSGPCVAARPDEDLNRAHERAFHEHPDRPALRAGELTVTYGELGKRVEALADELLAAGLSEGEPVAVLQERTPELFVAALAVMRAGGAYLPIDPALPDARIAALAEDARPAVLIAGAAAAARWPRPVHVLDPGRVTARGGAPVRSRVRRDPASAAYVIYTSGSTGTPKGVLIPYAALSERIAGMQRAFPLAPDDRVLAKTTPSFDVSLWEICWPLATGASTVLADPSTEADAEALLRVIERHRVTVAHFVPAMLQVLLQQPAAGAAAASLRRVFSGGEPLGVALAEAFHRTVGAELVNMYGPAEATIDVVSHVCVPGEAPIPIGRPVDNTLAYVVDRHDRPVADGMPGELLLGGPQIGLGYLRRPKLTAQRFVTHPLAGDQRLYRTGDVVRRLPSGELEYLHRNDEQLKLRGVRLEPGEVETALSALPGIEAAAVAIRAPHSSHAQLIALLVAGPDAPPLRELPELARHVLPAHLVPSAFRWVDALPRTASGKLDRRAVQRLIDDDEACDIRRAGVLLTNPEETLVTTAMAELLDPSVPPGPDADFFALGGHSLLAALLAARLSRLSGTAVTVADVFRRRTVRALAELIAERTGAGQPAVLLPLRPAAGGDLVACLHPIGGGIGCYLPLVGAIDPRCELVALQARGLDGGEPPVASVPAMAADYLREIARECGRHPRWLVGWSFGGSVAFEMARRLAASGKECDLVLLDALPPGSRLDVDSSAGHALLADLAMMQGIELPAGALPVDPVALWDAAVRHGIVPPEFGQAAFAARVAVFAANRNAAANYRTAPAPVRATLWRPASKAWLDDPWSALCTHGLSVRELSGGHYDVFAPDALAGWTEPFAAHPSPAVPATHPETKVRRP